MKEGKTGYTTGTCAAAAAKAAALLLTKGTSPPEAEVLLPEGRRVTLPVAYARHIVDGAEAAVRKDAGDDPDITQGALVVVRLSPLPGSKILFAAGEGVGTVTKPGLSVPPGEAAINPVPRQMIAGAIGEITPQGMVVTVSIPGGEKLAEKTYNPRLGITGGLSVLGTTGIVRPFSISALRASLQCALDVAVACGVGAPVFVPGHIGRRAAERNFSLREGQIIETGNEWGFVLDRAAGLAFREILVVGHPGKLVKLAMGDWDTHSARSGSALIIVAQRAEELFGRSFSGQVTAEGVFASLAPEEARQLGDALAGEVCRAIAGKTGHSRTAAAFADMQGRIVGTAGDLRPWQ